MMDKVRLRKADFATSIILILFGIVELILTFQMPMQATFGGVRNVWYVSPALLPLFIGFSIIVLGTVLLVNSIRTGGAAGFIEAARKYRPTVTETGQRFAAILLALISFVFLFVPRVDFVLSIILFLFYFVAAFYCDVPAILQRMTRYYAGIVGLLLVLFVTPLADLMNGAFLYATDVVVLLSIVGLVLAARRLAGPDPELRRKLRVSLVVSLVTPALLAPAFRYFLLVPLPHEGGIVELMNLIYYSLR